MRHTRRSLTLTELETDPTLRAAFDVFGEHLTSVERRPEPAGRVTPSTQPPPSLRETAYHEAGHAVAHYHLGIPFIEVSIVPDHAKGTLGHVSSDWQPPVCRVARNQTGRDNLTTLFPRLRPSATVAQKAVSRAQQEAERGAITYLAGGWAQRLVSRAAGFPGSERDRRAAAAIISPYCDSRSATQGCLRRLDHRTKVLVDAEAKAIADLADQLLARRLIRSREATRVIKWASKGDAGRAQAKAKSSQSGEAFWVAYREVHAAVEADRARVIAEAADDGMLRAALDSELVTVDQVATGGAA